MPVGMSCMEANTAKAQGLGSTHLSQENRLELQHACNGQQHCGVLWHQ